MKAKKVFIYSIIIANIIAFITMIVCFFTGTNPDIKTMSVNAENTTQIREKPSNLTNTKWKFNEHIDVSTNFEYYINFNSYTTSYGQVNNKTFTAIRVNTYYGQNLAYRYTQDNQIWWEEYYTNNKWYQVNTARTYQNDYKGIWYIDITSGTDVQNTNLINWLYDNAVLLPNSVNNLTYKWHDPIDFSQIGNITTFGNTPFISNNTENFQRINFYKTGNIKVNYLYSTQNNNSIDVIYSNNAQRNRYKYLKFYDPNPPNEAILLNKEFIQFIYTFTDEIEELPTIENVTTLKNTKWLLSEKQAWFLPRYEYPLDPWGKDYRINFASNGNGYSFMQLHCDTQETQYNGIHYKMGTPGSTIEYANFVYTANNEKWTNQKYRLVIIYDGYDTENQILINYFLDFGSKSNQTITTGDILDIPDMMLKILSMPFSFISTAFNVTLWPGTAYQFNFSNFIMGLVAIATILFIIKLFTSGMGVINNYTGKADTLSKKSNKTDKKDKE